MSLSLFQRKDPSKSIVSVFVNGEPCAVGVIVKTLSSPNTASVLILYGCIVLVIASATSFIAVGGESTWSPVTFLFIPLYVMRGEFFPKSQEFPKISFVWVLTTYERMRGEDPRVSVILPNGERSAECRVYADNALIDASLEQGWAILEIPVHDLNGLESAVCGNSKDVKKGLLGQLEREGRLLSLVSNESFQSREIAPDSMSFAMVALSGKLNAIDKILPGLEGKFSTVKLDKPENDDLWFLPGSPFLYEEKVLGICLRPDKISDNLIYCIPSLVVPNKYWQRKGVPSFRTLFFAWADLLGSLVGVKRLGK